jgi:hypothetical protein
MTLTENTIIQTVSCCLASHEQCTGYYSDQDGNVLVRCVCRCHVEPQDSVIKK